MVVARQRGYKGVQGRRRKEEIKRRNMAEQLKEKLKENWNERKEEDQEEERGGSKKEGGRIRERKRMEVFEVFGGFRGESRLPWPAGVRVCVAGLSLCALLSLGVSLVLSIGRGGAGEGVVVCVRDLLFNVFSVCAKSIIERVSS